jgi:hypothetical protein
LQPRSSKQYPPSSQLHDNYSTTSCT